MLSFTIEPTFHKYKFVVQPKYGFRFSIDSVLLGHSVCSIDVDSVVELGAGSGIVSLIMYSHGIGKKFYLIEKDPYMCESLFLTITLNNLEDTFIPICDDISQFKSARHFADLVIFNPPFYIKGKSRGDLSVSGYPDLFVEVASSLVRKTGLIVYIIDSTMLNYVETVEIREGLFTVARFIYSSKRSRRVVKFLSKTFVGVPFVNYMDLADEKVKRFYYDGGV